ncbi:MAG: Dabb family protein [Phycisphaerae bacterium]|nr:Dabb family protein [Phycisphaerae bacterium]
MFTHVVLFWLKPGTPESARLALESDCTNLLGQIPGLKLISVGRPAMTPRDVVDNSYDIGLCTAFESSEGHDVYQKHPLHLDFISRNKAHWDRVRVVDFK